MMNFKIENSYVNITNYPYIERHFEKMAAGGWLISKIISGNLFLYKRIEPEELDFSISPYEVETAYTRKTKEELEEFQTVCEYVGWNFATKSYDLHVYYKEKDSEVVPLHTDEEEEFNILEKIAKKQLKALYFQIPLFILLAWMVIGRSLASVYGMKDGLTQIVSLLIPVALILMVINIYDLRKFLKINRKNIELGKGIEFNDWGFYGYKISFILFYISILVFLAYLLYSAIVFKNIILLMALIPSLIGIVVGSLYRIYVKPAKRSIGYKKVVLVAVLITATILSIGTGIFNIGVLASKDGPSKIEGYRVLSINDFSDETIEDSGDLRRNLSFLIPVSYDYSSYARRLGVIDTEYSRALTEGLARNLVNRYKREAENRLIGRNSKDLEFIFENGVYDSYYARSGLTEDDFISLRDRDKKEAVKEALEIIKERSIREDLDGLWDLDEVYFLNYESSEIVLRIGKEVFFLRGLDFSDPEIVEVVKDRLGLD